MLTFFWRWVRKGNAEIWWFGSQNHPQGTVKAGSVASFVVLELQLNAE